MKRTFNTTVRRLPLANARKVVASKWNWLTLALLAVCSVASAQMPTGHPLHAGVMPPGAIGRQRLVRGGPLCGYIQPVEVKLPAESRAAFAIDGNFSELQPGPQVAGLLVGAVYRLRVTDIPNNPGAEVYPTIELIDRLYPPAGKRLDFPVPIELTDEELNLAAQGMFVTRVIYVENPERALPVAQGKEGHQWFEVATGEDPLQVADQLGRPIAILRIGGRSPANGINDPCFTYGCPPVQLYERPAEYIEGSFNQ